MYPEDPDLANILKKGSQKDLNQGDCNLSDDDGEDFSKFMPLEFLKKLPGMDSSKVNDFLK